MTGMSFEPRWAGAIRGVPCKTSLFSGSRRPQHRDALSLVTFFWRKRKWLAHLHCRYYEARKAPVCETVSGDPKHYQLYQSKFHPKSCALNDGYQPAQVWRRPWFPLGGDPNNLPATAAKSCVEPLIGTDRKDRSNQILPIPTICQEWLQSAPSSYSRHRIISNQDDCFLLNE